MKYLNMQEKEYNELDALRSSDIKLINDSLYAYKHREFVQKPHLDYGIALHAAILEPEKFGSDYIRDYSVPRPEGIATKLAKNGGCKEAYNDWKIGKNEWLDNNRDKIILSDTDMDAILWSRDNIYKNTSNYIGNIAKNMITDGQKEVAYMAHIDDKINGKSKPDITLDNAILDIKTASGWDFRNADKTISKWKYHMQGTWHADIVERVERRSIDAIFYLFIEKEKPYRFNLVSLDTESRETARTEIEMALDKYSRYLQDPKLADPCINDGGKGSMEKVGLSVWDIGKVHERRESMQHV